MLLKPKSSAYYYNISGVNIRMKALKTQPILRLYQDYLKGIIARK